MSAKIDWSAPVSAEEAHRRASGRRRLNRRRKAEAWGRVVAAGILLEEWGDQRGIVARIAAALKVHPSTASRYLQVHRAFQALTALPEQARPFVEPMSDERLAELLGDCAGPAEPLDPEFEAWALSGVDVERSDAPVRRRAESRSADSEPWSQDELAEIGEVADSHALDIVIDTLAPTPEAKAKLADTLRAELARRERGRAEGEA